MRTVQIKEGYVGGWNELTINKFVAIQYTTILLPLPFHCRSVSISEQTQLLMVTVTDVPNVDEQYYCSTLQSE